MSLRALLKIYLILFILLPAVNAQQEDTLFYKDNYSIVIDSIKIYGNEVTEEIIILRELTFQIGDTLNPEIASFNRERVYSLDIFNEVKLKPLTVGDKNILNIEWLLV